VSVSVPAGFIEADLYDDLLKVAIFERHIAMTNKLRSGL